MKKLIILNQHDNHSLEIALETDAEIFLMQDAVLFTNNNIEINHKLLNHKVYALTQDVEKRGLKNRTNENIELIDIDTMVDHLFSGKTVLNL